MCIYIYTYIHLNISVYIWDIFIYIHIHKQTHMARLWILECPYVLNSFFSTHGDPPFDYLENIWQWKSTSWIGNSMQVWAVYGRKRPGLQAVESTPLAKISWVYAPAETSQSWKPTFFINPLEPSICIGFSTINHPAIGVCPRTCPRSISNNFWTTSWCKERLCPSPHCRESHLTVADAPRRNYCQDHLNDLSMVKSRKNNKPWFLGVWY